jgi:membrane protein YdbS with pleckstrin-like domain
MGAWSPFAKETAMRIGTILVIIWLVIGVVAATQRNYFSGSKANCAKVGTIAVTVLAGPLNYVGVNPKIKCEFSA